MVHNGPTYTPPVGGEPGVGRPGPPAILLVEDSPEDSEITVRGLASAGVTVPILHCTDGDDALDYLYRRERYAEDGHLAPRPGLILLDLNLPGTDGREVLETIKRDRTLSSIPVVVLTTSANESDIDSCYRLGANSYIQKAVDLAVFRSDIARLTNYWLATVTLPKEMPDSLTLVVPGSIANPSTSSTSVGCHLDASLNREARIDWMIQKLGQLAAASGAVGSRKKRTL